MAPSRLDIRFTGRVQGVGFRARTAAIAARRGITGWVRNEPDGSVRCVAAGERAGTEAFLEDVLKEMSRYIEHHEVTGTQDDEQFSSFTVRYA